MRRKISIGLLLIAWLCAQGAIWNMVQVVGWAKMYHDFSQVMPIAQALRLTFDGSAPCDLCKLAQGGQETAKQTQLPDKSDSGSQKLLLISEGIPSPVLIAPLFAWAGAAKRPCPSRTEPVPVPPPRV